MKPSSKTQMDQEPDNAEYSPPNSANSHGPTRLQSPFPDEVLEKVLSFIDSRRDRSSISLVHKNWYNAERWTRSKLFIGNCYAVSPEIVARRFPKIKSVTLKGKPRFSDFNMLPFDWGANVHSWLVMFAKVYPFLEELRLKRMTVTDESLELLAKSFPDFKALSLWCCDGFTENGLKAIARHCRNLTELDIPDIVTEDVGVGWLSCFPENFTSLEVLNFSRLNGEVSFDDLERLVVQSKSLRVLKVNESVTLDQLQRLLVHAPGLVELGTGSFPQELTHRHYKEIETAFSNSINLRALSGRALQSGEFAKLLAHCPNLRRLWVIDTVEDKGLEAVGSCCPLLEELRVFPADPHDQHHRDGVTELGFLAISHGCRKLHYVLYFCRRMTNDAVATIVRNCPDFTHFRLCIMTPGQPDYITYEPMDEAFGAVVRTCTKLIRFSVSGLLTDLTFKYIGNYAKNLECLSVAFAGSSDWGMQCIMEGCPKLRKLEIRDCPFGNTALLCGKEKYEMMRSLWMSSCKVTLDGCRRLAAEMPRLNVEVISEEGSDDDHKVYVYRSLVGPRRDAPAFVLTL